MRQANDGRPARADRGTALLEALVALVVLSTAGLALVEALQGAMRAQVSAANGERRLLDGDRLMRAHALLDGASLDQRLGVRTAGEWEIRITRPRPELYRLELRPREGDAYSGLVTLLHRPGRDE